MKARFHLWFIVLTLVLASCGPVQAQSATTTPSVQPSSTPHPTGTSTSVPPPTVTLTATPVPDGPCDNPLVPLVTGSEWTYLVTGDKDPYLYDLKVGGRADIGNININVEMIDRTHNRDVRELVVCQEGAIDNYPLYFMSMIMSGYLDGIVNTFKQSGQYAPAYPVFVQNDWKYSWESQYLFEEGVGVWDPVGGGSVIFGQNAPIDVDFKTDGIYEPVTVPAGSFPQALVVLNNYTMQGTVTTGGLSTSGTVIIRTTQWYVPYVGLVRARINSASVSIFAGQESSIQMVNVLELTRFTPGR